MVLQLAARGHMYKLCLFYKYSLKFGRLDDIPLVILPREFREPTMQRLHARGLKQNWCQNLFP
jgi:hypothetical protein